MWIALEATDHAPADFDPGHVLGLGLRQDGHTLMRHAYTVSRGEPRARRFEHLYRIVSGGRMSPRLAQLAVGDEVFFHGPFHTPIQHEIQPDAEQIVLISTGAGVGPVFGYAGKTLAEGEFRPITLYAGFREDSDTCLTNELNALANSHENFSWHFSLTQPSDRWRGLKGRVTESVPSLLDSQKLSSYHFHLVGNGEMVNLVEAALHRAGVSERRVSTETYFNHYNEPAENDVEDLAMRFKGGENPIPFTGEFL
jgi:ferredoxin-NADP reductase